MENTSSQFENAALEKEWISRASHGDPAAFNQLVLTYRLMAYNHVAALLGDADLAEDVTQEAFLNAYQGMAGFQMGSFRSWLLRIATNASYDVLRKIKRYPTQPLLPEDEDGDEVESPAWLADPNARVETTVERSEETRRVVQMLVELPDFYRRVITLIDVDGLDYAEAAHLMRVPIGTIKSRLARARHRIQKRLSNSQRWEM